MNDWIGDTQGVMATLNASSHGKEDRQENDFYATPPKATEMLCKFGLPLSKYILEPACGQGHISKVLINNGHKVFSSDKYEYGYGEKRDFLSDYDTAGRWTGDIITNPPYKIANEFLEKAMDMLVEGRFYIAFLRIQYLEGKARSKLYKKFPPKYVYVSSGTFRCAKNGDFENATGNASTYCWFVWEKGFTGEPVIRWFNT